MSVKDTQQVAIKGNESEQVRLGQLHSLQYSSGERMGRAVKVLLICLVLALITAFIPIAHFFLVPLFLIAGPVMAVMKYKQDSALEKAEGECPECGERVDIELEPTDKLPKRTYCPSCNKPLQLLYHAGSID